MPPPVGHPSPSPAQLPPSCTQPTVPPTLLMPLSVPAAAAILGLVASAIAYPLEQLLKRLSATLVLHITLLRNRPYVYLRGSPVTSCPPTWRPVTFQTLLTGLLKLFIYVPLLAFSLLSGLAINGTPHPMTRPLRTILYTPCAAPCDGLVQGALIGPRLQLVANRAVGDLLQFWGAYIADVAREQNGILDTLRPAWELRGAAPVWAVNITTETAFQNLINITTIDIARPGRPGAPVEHVVKFRAGPDVDAHLRGNQTVTGSLIQQRDDPHCQFLATNTGQTFFVLLDVTPRTSGPCELVAPSTSVPAFSALLAPTRTPTAFSLRRAAAAASFRGMLLSDGDLRVFGSQVAYLSMEVLEGVVVEVVEQEVIVAEFRPIWLASLLLPAATLATMGAVVRRTGRQTRLGTTSVFECVVGLLRKGRADMTGDGVLEIRRCSEAEVMADGEEDAIRLVVDRVVEGVRLPPLQWEKRQKEREEEGG